jgi:hypothetical protein
MGTASRKTKKNMAKTKRIALIPHRRMINSSSFSPAIAMKERWGKGFLISESTISFMHVMPVVSDLKANPSS